MRPPAPRTVLREYFEALLIAMIFALFARTYAVQAFKIPTGSMEENLLVGDHILVNKFAYGPSLTRFERAILPEREIRRGDVVVFKFPDDPSRDFIKRCIGLPGDRIEIVAKETFVNGARISDEGYVLHTDNRTYQRDQSLFLHASLRLRDNFGPYTVPDGHYFFLGDNRDNSNDSRFWGAVPADYIKGRAFMVYWSFDAEDHSVAWSGYKNQLRQMMDVGAHFLSRTRWERSFRLVR